MSEWKRGGGRGGFDGRKKGKYYRGLRNVKPPEMTYTGGGCALCQYLWRLTYSYVWDDGWMDKDKAINDNLMDI